MNSYPFEPGQRMIVRPNNFGPYVELGLQVVSLQNVISTSKGIIANCTYNKGMPEMKELAVSIPLFLLWRIADDEDLLEMHENYVYSKNLLNLS